MLSKTMQDAINEQIQKEYHSSYLYLAMAAYCEASNLPGSAKWMRMQSAEELSHAMKLFEHMVDRGGRVADYPAQVMLQWFVTEQVEEEKNAGQVVEQLKAVGESRTSLMLLDRHLGKRGGE